MLLRVVDAMSKGLCVTVSPTSRTPITPQSADVDEISCIDQILADVHRTRKAIAAERREAETD
ncbi:hypothetical protein SB749_14870 [Brevibacterium sp. SIMBA_078]|uniref:hypothetical protein n=1 Tax=Brevibacterium sp. SIMBA_078 TaxID=3085816 RepID=UPI00397CA9A1